MYKKILIALSLSLFALHSKALSLSEYGITLTSTGLIDHVSGLRWLDSSLTDGDLDDLQLRLDEGWRIASEEEFYFLVTRQMSAFGGSAVSALGIDGMNQLAARLSFTPNQEPSGPWLCRDYGDPEQYCQSTGSLGGNFVLNLTDLADDTTLVQMLVFISEVPIYGGLDCGVDVDCVYEGRSLMVRAVPLPAAGWLFLSALASLTVRRRSGRGSKRAVST